MEPTLRALTAHDYDAVLDLWSRTPGVTVRDADSRASTERYLARNPGLSFVAVHEGAVVGCVLAGHDGRRGYLQHLVVLPAFRRRGLGRALVERSLAALAAEGIAKSHVDVLATNELGLDWWARHGWQRREDLVRFSHTRGGAPNA